MSGQNPSTNPIISKENLRDIEYLFAQSVNGLHLLFDHKKIAPILSTPTENIDFFTFENVQKMQDLFDKLINLESLDDKRAFINDMDDESFEIMVRSYFNIVENAVLESTDLKH